MIINVTPVGMAGGRRPRRCPPQEPCDAAKVVFDVVALPAETPLIRPPARLARP